MNSMRCVHAMIYQLDTGYKPEKFSDDISAMFTSSTDSFMKCKLNRLDVHCYSIK